MTQPVVIGNATLYCGDCERLLSIFAGRADAIVTDPPYGIGEARADNKSRSSLAASRDYGLSDWDDRPPSDGFMSCLTGPHYSKWQIIFGGNYFRLPPAKCWLVWDKLNGANDFADCELAWTNLDKAVRRIQYRWHGMIRQNNEPRGDHPTQKPVGVMLWCLRHLPQAAKTILDPYMGSGTTGVACAQLGLRFIGVEREPKYFDIACKRIEAAYAQGRLFAEPEAAPEQTSLEDNWRVSPHSFADSGDGLHCAHCETPRHNHA